VFSPVPLSRAQSQVHLKHPVTPINEEYRHTSRASRSPSPSAPSGPAPGGKPESGKRGEKRGRQDTHIEISSETHHSVNTDDTCDTSDEDPRPAKRRKPRSARAVTPPLHLRRSPPQGRRRPPDLRLTRRCLKMITDVCRPSSIIATSMPRGILGVRLRHQRRYQLLSIRSGPCHTASSNASGSGMI
jgi:hypothetical protein